MERIILLEYLKCN